MFLALKELRHSKGKFALIIAVVVLISYLVYFLTSLAYGLASSYTNAVEKWGADEIIITVDANDSMMMSFITDEDYDNINVQGEKAKLGMFPAVINNPSAENILNSRMDVYFFGVEQDAFIMPEQAYGLDLSGTNVIADEKLKKEGYKIGDLLGVSGSDTKYQIIAFSVNTTYQTAPVIYMDLQTWQLHRYGETATPSPFSAVLVRGFSTGLSEDLMSYTTPEYISTLPGYTAQVLTFLTMIVFLVIIVAFVLGIFIYVLTIQKTSMFGVMKAQGISNAYIAGSVVLQTFILVLAGVFFGLILTIASGLFLGDAIPFSVNYLFYLVITIAFFVFALLGALFSVKAVLKIDPLKAIGG